MNAAKAKAAAKARHAAAAKGKGKEVVPAPSVDPTPAPAAAVSRPRPAVTQYWGDGVSTITAPGGGILRIGYDQARFEQAVKEVIMEPEDLSPLGGGAGVGLANEEAKVDGEMRKEDVGVLVTELEVSVKEAEEALKRVGGDLSAALWALTGPREVVEFKQGPGPRPVLSVGGEL